MNNIKEEDLEKLAFYTKRGMDELNIFLRTSIKNNVNMDVVKYVLSANEYINKIRKNDLCKLICDCACNTSNVELMKYVCGLEDSRQSCHNAINQDWNVICKNNDIEMLHYLLIDSPIKTYFRRFDMVSLLESACKCDNVEVMEFVFDNKLLKYNDYNSGVYRNLINYSCINKRKNTMEYMLMSPIFTPYISIAKTLEMSVEHNNTHLQEYIIFHNTIELNKKTRKYIESQPHLKEMLDNKKFNDKLQNMLENKTNNPSKMKI